MARLCEVNLQPFCTSTLRALLMVECSGNLEPWEYDLEFYSQEHDDCTAVIVMSG